MDVFSEPEDSSVALRPQIPVRDTQSEDKEESEEEDNDAQILSAWMESYRAGEAGKMQKEEAGEARSHKLPAALHAPTSRRSSLPCPVSTS